MPSKYTPNNARIENNVAYITLTNQAGQTAGVALVDLMDLHRVLAFGRWYLQPADETHNTGYVVTRKDGRTILLHRFILDAPEGQLVDHRNHDGMDCRRANLRPCTPFENRQNLRGANKGSRSGARGVYWQSGRGRWGASVCVKGKRHFLGSFATVEEADSAARAARQSLMPFATN